MPAGRVLTSAPPWFEFGTGVFPCACRPGMEPNGFPDEEPDFAEVNQPVIDGLMTSSNSATPASVISRLALNIAKRLAVLPPAGIL